MIKIILMLKKLLYLKFKSLDLNKKYIILIIMYKYPFSIILYYEYIFVRQS